MSPPRLEIAIPTYERPTVVRAVRSALAVKTLRADTRVVVYNNGKAERLEQLLRSFPVEIVHNEKNLGMVGNWNRALGGAVGDYVIILHDDDELLAERTLKAVDALSECRNAAFLFSAVQVVDGAGRVQRLFQPFRRARQFLPPGGALDLVREAVPIKFPGVILRRELADGGRMAFDERFGYVADAGFYLAAALRAPALYWPEPSARYTMDMTTTTFSEMFVPRDIDALAAVRDSLAAPAAESGLRRADWFRALNRWLHHHAVISALFQLWKGKRGTALGSLRRARELAGRAPWNYRLCRLFIYAMGRSPASAYLYPTARWLQRRLGELRPAPCGSGLTHEAGARRV